MDLNVDTDFLMRDADLLMCDGLKFLGYEYNSDKVCNTTWEDRFRGHYGSNPIVYAKLYNDLKTTTITDARVEAEDLSIKYFLMSLHFLRCFPSELRLGAMFQISEPTVRKWTRFYIKKIQSLKPQKIVWPNHWDEIFIISVDGTHCPIEEPQHATLSNDKTYYSHKTHQPAVNYEIGISIFRNKCVWINCPFPAGMHDITVFRQPNGLKSIIPEGKKVIGDEGYRGEYNIITTSNPEDTIEVKRFKRRAKSRHETFNAKIKTFHSISARFNRSLCYHKSVFEAVCVIVQYQLESGGTLYDV